MGDEYSWYAGLEPERGEHDESATFDENGDSDENGAVLIDYLNICHTDLNSTQHTRLDEMADVDLCSDKMDDNQMASSFISQSSGEIAIIQPHTHNDISSEEDYEKCDSKECVDCQPWTPTERSLLYVGGRVYTVTSTLVNSIQRFLIDGVRFAVESSNAAVNFHKNSLVSATRSEVNRLARRNTHLKHFFTLHSLSSCLVESCYFAVDRTRTYTKWYTASLTSDDPEVAHRKSIRNTRSIKNVITPDPQDLVTLSSITIKRRVRFPSISWIHRQMLHCTKDESLWKPDVSDINLELRPPCNVSSFMEWKSMARAAESSVTHGLESKASHELREDRVAERSPHIVMDRYSAMDALLAAFDDGDLEASGILTDLVTPPSFIEDDSCHICHQDFSMACFRHHCRNCGHSFCREHSDYSRPIYKYGYTDAVRVCHQCQLLIDEEARMDRVQWRLLRVRDYLSRRLIPFFAHNIDTSVDKAIRIVDGTLFVVKKALLQNYPAVLVVETVEILRRYGMSGLAGVLMRQDFVEAVDTLLKISGMDKHYPISLHELTACIYYKLAIDRGLRGCEPEREHTMHMEERVSEVDDAELDDIIRYASMALMLAYEESPTECQRLAANHGYTALCIQEISHPEEPAFAMYATSLELVSTRERPVQEMEVVLVIRGTSSIHDVVTDIRAAPAAFPPTREEIMHAIYGRPTEKCPGSERGDDVCVPLQIENTQEWEWLPTQSTKTYACGGICRSAMYVLSEVGASLIMMAENGYQIRVVGHSLGGAVGALVTYMLKSIDMENIHCFAYGVPSFLDDSTADAMREYVTSVVLHDDFIARVTPASIRLLIKEIQVFKSEIFTFLKQDWNDAISRAAALWSPRVREAAPVNSLPSSSSKCSTDSLQREDAAADSDGDERQLIATNSGDCVLVNEHEVIQLWLPGRIVHMFSRRGIYEAAAVPRTFSELRKIIVQGNIFRDHSSVSIFDALLEVRAGRRAQCVPPEWTSYDADAGCKCCGSNFTWHSTFRGEAQQYRERYNCRSCGGLVCGPCSLNRQPVLRLGLILPSRLCDRCFFSGKYTDAENPVS